MESALLTSLKQGQRQIVHLILVKVRSSGKIAKFNCDTPWDFQGKGERTSMHGRVTKQKNIIILVQSQDLGRATARLINSLGFVLITKKYNKELV